MTSGKVLELDITLNGIEPRLWRKALVSGETTLEELHHILQVVLGWTNSHLHAFRLPGGSQASDPAFRLDEMGERWLDERQVLLGSVLIRRGSKLTYEYDFGDGWEHTVRLAGVRDAAEVEHPWPWCLEGARACPPEDVGGCGGYEELVSAITHGPQTEWQEELLEWGQGYDPERFSVDSVNASLKELCGAEHEPSRPEASVPKAMRERYEQIVARSDEFCGQHLNAEYGELCREMVAALARKRPSPLKRGRVDVWVAGIVYALGRVNFLSDPSFEPHMRLAEIGPLLGVGKSTASAKGNAIAKTLKIDAHDPEWMLDELLEESPLAWMVETDTGLVIDARMLPATLQRALAADGLIPYATV